MSNLIHFSETDLSDFSKEANGFRCRTYKEWWTEEELEAEYKYLSGICEDNRLEETKREAEALVALGQLGDAKAILDDANNARAVNGGLPALADATYETIMHSIYYEHCIELYHAAKGVQYFFMRRYDMLQIGTPLHFPIPANELETTGDELYSHGGVAFADGEGTASGTTSWDTNPPF